MQISRPFPTQNLAQHYSIELRIGVVGRNSTATKTAPLQWKMKRKFHRCVLIIGQTSYNVVLATSPPFLQYSQRKQSMRTRKSLYYP